jgi:serine-type D-Ala-D-Ala carboxypeptidase/endopeptidase (penicillin-binding protein 4)
MVMRWLRSFAALLSLGFAGAVWSQGLPPAVAKELATAGVPASAIGIVVAEPGGRTLLAHNADIAMNPASVMKLVTTTAALDLLGPAFTWRTEMHLQGRLDPSGRLEGDLILKGNGDPRFTLENFWMLLRDVRARGVRDITGDLVVDRTLFAPPDIDPGAFDGEPTRPYNVGPDAALVNFKAIRLTFAPDAQTRTVRIYAEPSLPELRIVNNLSVSDAPCDGWPEKPESDFATSTLSFNGSFPLACGEKVKHFSILPPLDYLRSLFDQLWRGLNGTFSGKVREGAVPPGSKALASFESPTLVEIVRDINKNSNNVMARQLYLGLGHTCPPANAGTVAHADRCLVEEPQPRHAGIGHRERCGPVPRGADRTAQPCPAALRSVAKSVWTGARRFPAHCRRRWHAQEALWRRLTRGRPSAPEDRLPGERPGDRRLCARPRRPDPGGR